jgi:hypothetical protein
MKTFLLIAILWTANGDEKFTLPGWSSYDACMKAGDEFVLALVMEGRASGGTVVCVEEES